MRLVMFLLAVALAGFAAAQPADLGATLPASAPSILFTRSAGAHAVQELPVQLERGENRLLVDAASLETDPGTIRVRLLEPADKARLTATTIGPQPGQVVAAISADEPVRARLRLSYEITTLQAEVSYSLTLDPARQQLALQADLTVRNNGKRDLRQAQATLAQGQQTTLSLRVGETVQRQLLTVPDLPYTISYLYDNGRFKDTVRTLLTIPAEARAKTPLPAGKARLYAPDAGGGRTLVAEAAMAYAPAGEKIELDLGAAPELAVLRTRLRSDQVNVRTDVYHKLALFDLDEEYELELSNRRPGPVTLVVRERVPGDWQFVKGSQQPEQTDSGTLEWTIRLNAGAKEKLTYSVKRLNVEP